MCYNKRFSGPVLPVQETIKAFEFEFGNFDWSASLCLFAISLWFLHPRKIMTKWHLMITFSKYWISCGICTSQHIFFLVLCLHELSKGGFAHWWAIWTRGIAQKESGCRHKGLEYFLVFLCPFVIDLSLGATLCLICINKIHVDTYTYLWYSEYACLK